VVTVLAIWEGLIISNRDNRHSDQQLILFLIFI